MNINLFKVTKAYVYLYLSIEKRKKRRLEYCNAIELELFILNVLIRYWFEIYLVLKTILVKKYLVIKISLKLFEMSLRW